ncbi:MAG: aldehyde dehydrogenase, partial [Polaromonas sp.]|nr:aldehyde dehydrogenase [Polaromonas sp.]
MAPMNAHPTPCSLQSLFNAQHRASRAHAVVPLALRRERLMKVRALLEVNGPALAQAVQADFGVRSAQLTEIADLFVLRTLLAGLLKNLPRWMKPVKVR